MDNPQGMEYNFEQGTSEWFAVRLGKVTASRTSDVTAKTKSGYSASKANYMAQLLVERLTGAPQESYTNAAMLWGTEQEPRAREMYQFITDNNVQDVGFVAHPTIEMAGCSPDGLIGDDGLLEIKSPNTSTHIDTLLGESINSKYISQIQFQMACTGRKWCDFVSFDPRLPVELQIKIQRVERDDAYIAMLETEVKAFLAELDNKLKQLEALK